MILRLYKHIHKCTESLTSGLQVEQRDEYNKRLVTMVQMKVPKLAKHNPADCVCVCVKEGGLRKNQKKSGIDAIKMYEFKLVKKIYSTIKIDFFLNGYLLLQKNLHLQFILKQDE